MRAAPDSALTKACIHCNVVCLLSRAFAHWAAAPPLAAAGLIGRDEVHQAGVTGPVGCGTASVHTAVEGMLGVDVLSNSKQQQQEGTLKRW